MPFVLINFCYKGSSFSIMTTLGLEALRVLKSNGVKVQHVYYGEVVEAQGEMFIILGSVTLSKTKSSRQFYQLVAAWFILILRNSKVFYSTNNY